MSKSEESTSDKKDRMAKNEAAYGAGFHEGLADDHFGYLIATMGSPLVDGVLGPLRSSSEKSDCWWAGYEAGHQKRVELRDTRAKEIPFMSFPRQILGSSDEEMDSSPTSSPPDNNDEEELEEVENDNCDDDEWDDLSDIEEENGCLGYSHESCPDDDYSPPPSLQDNAIRETVIIVDGQEISRETTYPEGYELPEEYVLALEMFEQEQEEKEQREREQENQLHNNCGKGLGEILIAWHLSGNLVAAGIKKSFLKQLIAISKPWEETKLYSSPAHFVFSQLIKHLIKNHRPGNYHFLLGLQEGWNKK